MSTQKELTNAELERLLTEAPVPGKLSRRELISQLDQAFAQLKKQTIDLAAVIKKEGPNAPKFDQLTDEIQELSARQLKVARRLQRLKNPQSGITSLAIENFKGIGPAITVPLRPITLLFGANSAGKSSIVQALHYARELLERNNANPDRTLTGGDAIEMGGFRNLVHKHDLEKEIRIRIEITPSADGVPTLDEMLGTASQEREVRVSAERIQRTLGEMSRHGTAFSSSQREHLWVSLQRRLEPLWASVFERADRSKDVYEERLRETFEKLTMPMPSLEWQKFLVRALEKPDEKGQVSFNADELKKLLAQQAEPESAGEQPKQQLRDRLLHELLNVWSETSKTELAWLKTDYRERLTSEFQQALDSVVRSSFRSESESGWRQLTDYLMRSVESSNALDINRHIETVGVELVARWDFETQKGWFSECRYFLDGRTIITIRKPKPDSWPSLETIDYFHPVMLAMDESLKEEQEQYGEELAEQMAELDGDLKHRLLRKNASPTLGFAVVRPSTGTVLVDKDQRLTPALIKQLVEALPDVACLSIGAEELIPQAREEIETAIRRFQEREIQLRKRLEFHPLIQLADATSVAPDSNRALPFRAADLGESREHFLDVINQIVVGITALARQHLQQFRYIGPIRAIPERNHEAPQIEDPSRWSNGLAAWDLLLRQNAKDQKKKEKSLVESVSEWMEKSDRLNLGYRLEVSEVKPLPEDSLLMNHLALLQSRYDEKNQHEFRETVWKPLQNLPHTRRIRIVDTRTKTEVAPKDIGMGVAQVIPIVVAALDPKCRLLSVEQPELHLHPRVACDLADLFISRISQDKLFLIETHSEHLLLRLMRRIRENAANPAPKSELQVQAADVAILFVEHAKSQPKENYEGRIIVREMPLNERGDLVKAWPDGFFEENLNEVL